VSGRDGPAGPRFSVGDLVHHKRFDYRGVVIGVDPRFEGTEEWYETVARSRPPKDRPWYHVLVDRAEHATYVAERNLEADYTMTPIQHPMLGALFDRFEDGVYVPRRRAN
jgi:heat shock protein HspQ